MPDNQKSKLHLTEFTQKRKVHLTVLAKYGGKAILMTD